MSSLNPFPKGVLLVSVAPKICAEWSAALTSVARLEVAAEILRLTIPLQRIAGSANSFSCMAYSEPRLSLSERQRLNFGESTRLNFECGDGAVALELDEYGRISWIWVSNIPSLYTILDHALNQVRGKRDQEP